MGDRYPGYSVARFTAPFAPPACAIPVKRWRTSAQVVSGSRPMRVAACTEISKPRQTVLEIHLHADLAHRFDEVRLVGKQQAGNSRAEIECARGIGE